MVVVVCGVEVSGVHGSRVVRLVCRVFVVMRHVSDVLVVMRHVGDVLVVVWCVRHVLVVVRGVSDIDGRAGRVDKVVARVCDQVRFYRSAVCGIRGGSINSRRGEAADGQKGSNGDEGEAHVVR